MAPISPGFQLAPSRKAKKQTTSTNLHRYESFTKRIAKLKIDPVHTVEKKTLADDEKDLLQSFFRTALDEWAELNLSHTFTSFHAKVNPLCENLPQLLHHADTIFNLLAEHIEKNDEIALEALLSLLAHLAHDLGQNFEQYFSGTVKLVAQVAASQEKADVIEWCFTCLAWMFKYLARLLVQDLRPLLDIMIPYLSSKKDYIVRFSAESLAFLLRKAAVLYQKKRGPLTLAIKHLMEILPKDEVSPPYSPYQLGVMSLCVDTARGLDGQLHSCSASLVRCLLDTSLSMGGFPVIHSVVEGVLIGLIHETNSSSFHPVFEVALEVVGRCAASKQEDHVPFAVRVVSILITTRRGSRVSDWAIVIDTFQTLSQKVSQLGGGLPQLYPPLATITAQIFQNAPMDQLLPFSQRLLDFAAEHFSVRDFFAFSSLSAELGRERFTDLVLPTVQQYIVKHWSNDEVSLYYTLERLRRGDIAVGAAARPGSLVLPSDYETFALRKLTAAAKAEDASSIQELAGRVHSIKNIRLPQSSDSTRTAIDAYHSLLRSALDNPAGDVSLRQRTILGWGLDSYLDIVGDPDQSLHDLAQLALRAPSMSLRQLSFLQALVRLLTKFSLAKSLKNRASDKIRHLLVQNFLATASGLKRASIELLSLLEPPDSNVKPWLTETTELILDLLGTSYTPSEVRKIAMLLRRLPQLHRNAPADSTYQDLLPFLCLGLLSSYHDKARKEVCTTLAQLVEVTSTEESVLNVTLRWLQTPVDSAALQQDKGGDQAQMHLSSFECSHLAQVESLSASVLDDFQNSADRFVTMVEDAHRVEDVEAPRAGRSLALQVLAAIPASAERRSRLLVPVFLNTPFNRGQLPANSDSNASVSSHTATPDVDDQAWSLTDRKALLTLFSKFINPRVLYKFQDVHTKLIDLLSNGNDDIRKLALQAVLSWKDQVLIQYEPKLLQLAEGKLSASDISTLLSSDAEADSIRSTDRDIVLPIALRLVYGTIVGRAGTPGSQEARRKSLLRTLFRLTNHEVSTFLDIALGKLRDVKVHGASHTLASLDEILVPEDQQYGFLRLLLSMLETLQSHFAPYGREVVDAVVSCIVKVSRQGQHGVKATPSAALSRYIRRTGFQCLVLLFEHCHDIEWPRYLPVLFVEAISPRLDVFASETTQGISGLLRLFAVWTQSPDLVSYLGDYDSRVADVLWDALAAQPTPSSVKVFILNEIVLRWTEIAEDSPISPNKAHALLETVSDGLLKALIVLLERTPPKDILTAVTAVLPKLARFAKSSDSRVSAVKLLTSLLCDSRLKVAPVVKGQLLRSIQSFLSESEALDQDLLEQLVRSTSPLFNYFKDESNRQILCDVLGLLSNGSESLGNAARICKDLNAVSSQRLEEVDYDKRLQAFQAIENLDIAKSGYSCLPILYNLLYFVRTGEDFTIRSNALGCLKQIIIRGCGAEGPEVSNLVVASVLPVVKKCMQHESELVRADFVSLLGLLVQYAGHYEDLANMVPLLVGNDEEASFFLNILHIQQHRRLRAIRRLESEIEKGRISTKHIVEIFIPLLEMFVNDTNTDESAQGTKGQAIAAMGTLLRWLDWKHFKALLRKYRSAIDLVNGELKAAIRLLGHATDALLSAARSRADPEIRDEAEPRPRLAEALPERSIIQQELKSQFISKLAELIHYKDEAEISLRIPIAVITLKLVTLLPPDEVPTVASPVILDVANILRSRTQESRDTARKALCEIVLLLGPNSLQFVVKELRTALTRGYQLHVVSYTVHAILVALAPHTQHGDLDYCVGDLVPVVMDDIFGTVGQEKDNQDYVSIMKEVKSSKSFDSMELLARSISIASVSKLVSPLQTLLTGSLTTKQVRKIDELLRRTGMGLAQNPSAGERDILTFAYQMIQGLYQQKATNGVRTLTNDERNRHRYLIQLSSANKRTESQTSALLYKLAKFALDLVRSTLQRHADVLTSENVQGFLSVIGDALIEGQEDVKVSALRLLSAIMKLPMQELEDNAALYITEAVKIVKASTNTNEEAAQAALKLIAAVLRDKKNVKVRDSDVALILHRISPDIEEPDRQGVTFNFIRAVMARKIQIPEVYELADRIGVMMVTNQTKGARDVARGVFAHFLLDYPQSSSRWSKQQKFLVKNLEYEHPEGRQSVMETINTLVTKMRGDTVQELISTFFIPMLLQIINDDNEGCRQVAGALLGRFFTLADRTRLNEMFQPLNAWAEQDENSTLRKVSLQAYGILLDAGVNLTREELGQIVNNVSAVLTLPDIDEEDGWELQFQAFLLLQKLTESHPGLVLDRKQDQLWSSVWSSLSHHKAWIQSTSANLCIQFFSHCVSADHSKLPLTCNFGLSMNSEAFLVVLRAGVRGLRRTEGNENLSSQTVQILGFLCQCLDQNGLPMEVRQTSNGDEQVEIQSEDESDVEDEVRTKTRTISGVQYLLDQLTRILRSEANRLTTMAFLPKISALRLLSNILPGLSTTNLPLSQVYEVLLPLQHITDPNVIAPRSADPTFPATYQTLVESSHEVMEKLQKRLGDAEYVKALTEVSKIMRHRRDERRSKRQIERVAEPEKAARDKKRKHDRARERKKEIGKTHQRRRREVG
ncbi:U3 snoRNP protein [Cladophialophora chaetospira]|uniref:U3 snoRNP protein n=1 Tax=Cladophialophora chaetospira TaxID=386627 RepID=A0AA38X260_9EURO|nr:U3 snoRNP protein [Cladophialophora chaetospira]